jgi:hypothetical protein
MGARGDKLIMAGEMAVVSTRMEKHLSFLVDVNNELTGNIRI